MRGSSQFQHFITLSSSFPGEILREESPSAPLRNSRAGQRLPRGPLWPFTGSPQDEQHASLRLDVADEGEEATGAVAQVVDMMGGGEMAGTTETVAMVEATGAVAGMGASEADAGVEGGANEAEAGIVAAETVAAGEITGTEVGGGAEAGAAW